MNKERQHTLWLLAAAAAPAAHFSGCGWLTAALTALAVLPLTCLPRQWEGMGKALAFLEMLWMGAVAGMLLNQAAVYWPSDNDLVVPLTLLALASLTNAAAAPRIGAVLALCMGLLAIPMAVSGAKNVRTEWLTPEIGPWEPGLALAMLLSALPVAEWRGKGWLGILVVALAALVQGTISAEVASTVPDPFYQTARTLGYLEPVAAVAVTLGWYAAACMLMQSAVKLTKGRGAKVLPIAAAVYTIFAGAEVTGIALLLSVTLWVIVPMLRSRGGF